MKKMLCFSILICIILTACKQLPQVGQETSSTDTLGNSSLISESSAIDRSNVPDPVFLEKPITEYVKFENTDWGMSVDEVIKALNLSKEEVKITTDSNDFNRQTIQLENSLAFGQPVSLLLEIGTESDPIYKGLFNVQFATEDKNVMEAICMELDLLFEQKETGEYGDIVWKPTNKASDYFSKASWDRLVLYLSDYLRYIDENLGEQQLEMFCRNVANGKISAAFLSKFENDENLTIRYVFQINGTKGNLLSFAMR